MARRSQKTASDQEQFDRTGPGCASPDGADSVGGPSVGVQLLLSRSGMSHPRGKLDAELGKVRMHSETVAVLQVMAAQQGMSLSEFVRIHLDCVAWGAEAVATMAADRIRRVGELVGSKAPHGSR